MNNYYSMIMLKLIYRKLRQIHKKTGNEPGSYCSILSVGLLPETASPFPRGEVVPNIEPG